MMDQNVLLNGVSNRANKHRRTSRTEWNKEKRGVNLIDSE